MCENMVETADKAAEQSMFEQVGRYKVVELIGEGSMAEVYKAYDPEIDRTLALKILKQEWCLDEDYVGRFMREARAAGAFSHPNIVTVYDIGKVDNRPFMIGAKLRGLTPNGSPGQSCGDVPRRPLGQRHCVSGSSADASSRCRPGPMPSRPCRC